VSVGTERFFMRENISLSIVASHDISSDRAYFAVDWE
jgi:hypothetical protein